MTKTRKSGKVCPAGVGILLCQVGSGVGMVLCVYIESSWFLVSQPVFLLIPHPYTRKAPNSSSFYLPTSTQHGSPHLATVDTADLSLISSQGRLIQNLLEDDLQEQQVFSSL